MWWKRMIHKGQEEVGGNACSSEPYFSKGKENAKDEDSFPLPNLSLLLGPPSASSHACPDPVSATGNLSSN